MNCSIATETMLEADPQDLTGDNDSDLARHIAACARCRAIAEHLVQGQLGLARELDELSPQTAVDEAIQIAGRRASAIRRRNLRWQIGTPLAAAAGLVGLVLLKHSTSLCSSPPIQIGMCIGKIPARVVHQPK